MDALQQREQIGKGIGQTLYLICGIACLACALIAVFGSMFTSIGMAFFIALAIASPIFVGLFGYEFNHRIFPILEILGCGVMLTSIGSIFIGDFKTGPASTAFIREPEGWVVAVLYTTQIFFAIKRIKDRPYIYGA
jgi:hypothetical protein